MPPVELLPIDLAFSMAFDEGPPSSRESGASPLLQGGAGLPGRLRRQILTLPGSDLPWGGFLAIDPVEFAVVGTCGFKGAPTPDQTIEIAYHTFPTFEGRGYATAMARALVDIAWMNPALRSVCAHTLPQPSASTRVLGKVGMRRVGEVTDPAEGPVWRWRLARPGRPRGLVSPHLAVVPWIRRAHPVVAIRAII